MENQLLYKGVHCFKITIYLPRSTRTYSSVYKVESVGTVPVELGVPKLKSVPIGLGLGQCAIVRPSHLAEPICQAYTILSIAYNIKHICPVYTFFPGCQLDYNYIQRCFEVRYNP